MIKEILDKLGYKLKDFGDHYRTRAIYRGGSSDSSVLIHKNSGVFIDFGMENEYLPFYILISRTIGDAAAKELLKNNDLSFEEVKKDSRLSEEKSYDKSILKYLLPSYDFYLQRGISKETQQLYQNGFATRRDFYKRIVFPIFREDGRIHGFSGRSIDPNNEIKWLHKGKKQNWIYPLYLEDAHGNFPILSSIKERREVFIVESIGDSMALFQNGFQNNIVSFGLKISPFIISRLSAFNINRYNICFNNDDDSKENNGQIAVAKSFLNLMSIIPFQKIYCLKPIKNDFGDMQENDWDKFENNYHNISHQEAAEHIKETLQLDFFSKNKKYDSAIKKFIKHYNFNYG